MDKKGCLKCGSTEAGQKEIATTGTGFSKLFDVQNNRFSGRLLQKLRIFRTVQ